MASAIPVTSIGPTGALTPGFAAILTAAIQNYQSIYGSDADLSADTQDGQLVNVLMTAISDLCDLAVAVYNAFSPATAQGNGLSSVIKINGLTREVATNSSILIACVGVNGTDVSGLTLTDPNGNKWTLSTGVIPGGGSVNVTAICQTLGAVTLGTGVGMTITTPKPNFQSATTASQATPGNPVEADATLRQRQTQSTSLPAITPAAATLGQILNLGGVTRATYDENASAATDVNDVPARSIEYVVEGGVAQAIANAIALKKTQGAGTFGTTTVAVKDQYGITKNISFTILGYTAIYATVSLTQLAGYTSSTATLIQQVLVAAINATPISQQNVSNVTIGATVRYSKLFDAVNLSGDLATSVTGMTQAQLDLLSATYDVASFTIGTAPTPVGVVNVALTFGNAALTDTTKVLVS